MLPTFKQAFRFIGLCTIPAAGLGLLLTASLYLYLSPKLPSVETLKTVKFQTPLRVYSQDLQLIGEFGEKRRTPIEFKDIPLLFVQAMLAAEDDAFYSHIGVDFNGLIRAALELATTGSIQTGGSTITMQLARNFFLTREQSFTRKFNEILLALRIEDELSKDEIFQLYANKIYLGNRAYGVEAAALTYYGRTISNLTLAELAMIAGLPKAPSTFNPIINPDRAISRRDWILRRMVKLGFISLAQYEDAKNSPSTAQYHGPMIDYNAPYVAEEARLAALTTLGPTAQTDGYVVITTVDSKLQIHADQALRKGLRDYDLRHGYRGPEAHIKDPQKWRATLLNTPVAGALEPAIVTAVTGDTLTINTQSQDGVSLTKEGTGGLADLRLLISENSRSAPVKNLTEVFTPGDLIRIGYEQDTIYLAQLPQAQAALISLDPETGAIRALVGGFDFYQSHFNRVTQAQRQPGSNFKPFIYTAALEHGMSPATIINDAPVVFDNGSAEEAWRPENNSGEFYGPTRLRKALYLSRNLVSIRILRSVGINSALNTINKFGFDKKAFPRDLSLALGTHALTPLQIATGYATFANGGYKIEPYLIERIESQEGEVVFQTHNPMVCRHCELTAEVTKTAITADKSSTKKSPLADDPKSDEPSDQITDPTQDDPVTARSKAKDVVASRPAADRIVEPRIAYLIDSMLKDVIIRGTGTKAQALKRTDIAGKTGTTNGPRDAWFSGYNPDLVTTVWLGFDDNKLLGKREFGGSAALPIWIDYMTAALADKPVKRRVQPDGLVSVKIDPETGKRAGPNTPNAIFELFLQENVPMVDDTLAMPSTSGSRPAPLPEDIF